jgi:putative transposase
LPYPIPSGKVRRATIEKLVDTGRKRTNKLRRVTNAILKITRLGMQCGSPPGRNLEEKPYFYPPWQRGYYYFRKWQKEGIWGKILAFLVEKERVRQGRNRQASAVAIDSERVKKGSLISLDTGIDGHKNVNGRKRHLAVDSLGLPLALHVSAANKHDGQEGIERLWQLEKASSRLELIRADQAYQGSFVECSDYYNWKVEITRGRLVKSLNQPKDSFLKRVVGRWKEALLGSIFSGD